MPLLGLGRNRIHRPGAVEARVHPALQTQAAENLRQLSPVEGVQCVALQCPRQAHTRGASQPREEPLLPQHVAASGASQRPRNVLPHLQHELVQDRAQQDVHTQRLQGHAIRPAETGKSRAITFIKSNCN